MFFLVSVFELVWDSLGVYFNNIVKKICSNLWRLMLIYIVKIYYFFFFYIEIILDKVKMYVYMLCFGIFCCGIKEVVFLEMIFIFKILGYLV